MWPLSFICCFLVKQYLELLQQNHVVVGQEALWPQISLQQGHSNSGMCFQNLHWCLFLKQHLQRLQSSPAHLARWPQVALQQRYNNSGMRIKSLLKPVAAILTSTCLAACPF
jgi:hypothetical protein